jgi:hypothetical protein
VHLPYVETVPAVPTGCFCSKIKFHYLTPLTDTRLVDLGTFRSTDVETTLPAGFRRGRFAARSSKRSPLGRG